MITKREEIKTGDGFIFTKYTSDLGSFGGDVICSKDKEDYQCNCDQYRKHKHCVHIDDVKKQL